MRREVLIGIILVCLVFLSFVDVCIAQPIEEWNMTFGGSVYDWSESLQQTSDRGYIIAGTTGSYGASSYAVYLIKTDSNGKMNWSKTFGGSRVSNGYQVQQTSDGGYIVVGVMGTHVAGNTDVYLIKTYPNGKMNWSKTFGGSGDEYGFSVQQTTDGGYIMVGRTKPFGAGYGRPPSGVGGSHSYDVYLIKTDKEGELKWNKTFGGSDYDCGWSVQQTSDGGYIIAGDTESFGVDYDDFYLIKTDKNGELDWSKTFGGSSGDHAKTVQQTSDGGYIIVGTTSSYGAGGGDVYLIKTDKSGELEWSKTFGGSQSDSGESVQQTSDGGYILLGSTESYGTGGRDGDIWLIKTDSNGNEEWNETFGGGKGKSVQQTSDGGYIITGDTIGGDIILIKVDDPFNYKGKYVIDKDKLSTIEKKAYSFVQKYATEQRVSPALFMAIIKQESNFNPNAIGDGGLAIGYMQLHWDAAYDAGYRSARGDSKTYAEEDWPTDGLDPDTNIKYGSGYIKICYEKCGSRGVYGNPLKNAISAYNQGWPSGPSLSNKDTYVDPVLDYYEEYKEKYVVVSSARAPTPGFEAIFAVAGLLAVAYVLRRRK